MTWLLSVFIIMMIIQHIQVLRLKVQVELFNARVQSVDRTVQVRLSTMDMKLSGLEAKIHLANVNQTELFQSVNRILNDRPKF